MPPSSVPPSSLPPSSLPPSSSQNNTPQAVVAAQPIEAEDDPGYARLDRVASLSAGALNAQTLQPPLGAIILLASSILIVGLAIGNDWLILAGTSVSLLLSLRVIWTASQTVIQELLSPRQQLLTLGLLGAIVSAFGVLHLTGWGQRLADWYDGLNWDKVGATGEVIGAVGQILIAILAVYVAWRQYVISKALTIQQNVITQQQTIDSYFQGVSDLVLDEEGLLEDLPLERSIAEGRTAAILNSVDANGKAKVIRFLSQSRLLTPLQRDGRLGWAILDGSGGYAEDRNNGIRVIDLHVMLAEADLSGTDLRWTDLSDAVLSRANLSQCSLIETNLARTDLRSANLTGATLMGAKLFYGAVKTATPVNRTQIPDYDRTGVSTGALIENANFTDVKRLSAEQRYYCCAWGGSATRQTIPGGCDDIPNRLGR